MRHEQETPTNRCPLAVLSTMLVVVWFVYLQPPSWGWEGRSTGSVPTSHPRGGTRHDSGSVRARRLEDRQAPRQVQAYLVGEVRTIIVASWSLGFR
jgi:hypothetical protein